MSLRDESCSVDDLHFTPSMAKLIIFTQNHKEYLFIYRYIAFLVCPTDQELEHRTGPRSRSTGP